MVFVYCVVLIDVGASCAQMCNFALQLILYSMALFGLFLLRFMQSIIPFSQLPLFECFMLITCKGAHCKGKQESRLTQRFKTRVNRSQRHYQKGQCCLEYGDNALFADSFSVYKWKMTRGTSVLGFNGISLESSGCCYTKVTGDVGVYTAGVYSVHDSERKWLFSVDEGMHLCKIGLQIM